MLQRRKSACPFHIYRHEVPLRSRGIWEREALSQNRAQSGCSLYPFLFSWGDIAKAGVSNILGTPRVAYEKLRGRADPASPVSNAPWITRG